MTDRQTAQLIALARSNGSRAGTAAGATRYLLANPPHDLLDELERTLAEQWPYRRSQSRWAGGDHTVRLHLDECYGCSGYSTAAWSSNGKWRGTDSHATLAATPRALAAFPTLLVGGLIVLDAEELAPREYRATWAEQARGFDLRPIRGYLIRGHHVQTRDMVRARRTAARARAQAAADARLQRKIRRPQDLARIWVGFDDSVRGGNCPHGTNRYAAQLIQELGRIGGIRADALLARRDDQYTRRAVAAAARRYMQAG